MNLFTETSFTQTKHPVVNDGKEGFNMDPNMVIVSVFDPDKGAQNNFKAHMLATDFLELLGVKFYELGVSAGTYVKDLSVAFAIEVPITNNTAILWEIRNMAKKFDQDFLVYIDGESQDAYLDDLMGSIDKIGKYTEVNREQALKNGKYYVDLTLDEYFVIK